MINKWTESKIEPMALVPYWKELRRLGVVCIAVGNGEIGEEVGFTEARRLGFEGEPQDIVDGLVEEIREIQNYWLECYNETS